MSADIPAWEEELLNKQLNMREAERRHLTGDAITLERAADVMKRRYTTFSADFLARILRRLAYGLRRRK